MKKPKKWCEHIGIMRVKVPVPRFVKGKQMAFATKFKWDYWYHFSGITIEDFKYCPICKKARPKERN